jgi:hypothetical protein
MRGNSGIMFACERSMSERITELAANLMSLQYLPK